MSLKKMERNKELIKRRKKNPKKWNLRSLGNEFNLHWTTVHKILQREGVKATTYKRA